MGSQLYEKIGQLKIQSSDGKYYKIVARQGGRMAGTVREEIEARTGKPVVSPNNASDLLSDNRRDLLEESD